MWTTAFGRRANVSESLLCRQPAQEIVAHLIDILADRIMPSEAELGQVNSQLPQY